MVTTSGRSGGQKRERGRPGGRAELAAVAVMTLAALLLTAAVARAAAAATSVGKGSLRAGESSAVQAPPAPTAPPPLTTSQPPTTSQPQTTSSPTTSPAPRDPSPPHHSPPPKDPSPPHHSSPSKDSSPPHHSSPPEDSSPPHHSSPPEDSSPPHHSSPPEDSSPPHHSSPPKHPSSPANPPPPKPKPKPKPKAPAPPPKPPVASFTASADPSNPRSFTLTSTSSDPDTPTRQLSLSWDLNDDGHFGDASGTKATVTLPSPGTHDVALRVSDGTSTDTARQAISVGDRPPTVALTTSPNPALVGQPVSVTVTASDPDGDPLTYAWNVNGGAYSSPTIPAQAFDQPGVYKVKVTVSANGASASDADAIVVNRARSASGLPLLLPFPVVRVRGQIFNDGTKFDVVSARAPRNATARARCTGIGCPRRRWVRAAARRHGHWVRFTQLERKLRPGTVVEIGVTKRGTIGKYTRFVVRAGKPPARRDRCIRGTSMKVVRCPAA
jgi:hypothetical protein